MFGNLLARLLGANRFKHRGDRFFLENDFAGALREYRRARSAVSSSDYRTPTLDALIRECSTRLGTPIESLPYDVHAAGEGSRDREAQFIPALKDLFELAIGEKSAERAEAYRQLGEDFQAGYVALVQGDADNALSRLDLAAMKHPASFILQLELGRALSMAGEMERARVELEKAYRMHSADPEVIHLLAAVDIQVGRFDEAASLLEPFVEKGKDSGPEALFLLGRAMAGLGKTEQAMARYRETVKLDSRFHEAYFEGAMILRDHGDLEGSLRLLTRASALVPDEVAYNIELARLVLDNELDEQVGLEACDRLMVTDEDNRWRYLSWIAELYVRRGWEREARDPLHKAVKLLPPDRTEERFALERRLAELEGRAPRSGR
jgi:tetratricopeptide (TPR) repeat protein